MQKKDPAQWSKLCNMLNNCAKQKNLQAGRRIHLFLIRSRLDREGLLVDHLIRFYTSCGSLQEAHQVFCNVQVRSVYTWNAIMSAHLKLGSSVVALNLYVSMIREGVEPDKVTFLCVTKACAELGALDEGRLVHCHIFHYGLDVDEALGSALITFYASFRCLCDASHVFNDVPTKDVVLWGSIISAYTHYSDTAALELFEAMLIRGHLPSHFIINCILKVCTSLRDVQHLHEHVIKNGFESDLVIGSSLVDSYGKFGDLDAAHSVFRILPKRDVVLWGALINGYAQHDHGVTALDLFCQMQQENIKPDLAIFLSVLEGCAQIADLKQGRVLHDRIIKSGFDVDDVIKSSLVNIYSVCGSPPEGCKVFDTILDRDVVSWGALLAGYTQHGYFQTVLELFNEMQEENIEPDGVILLSLLKACCALGALRKGWHFHDHIVRKDFECSIDVGNVLISMYVGCGSLEEARRVFDMLPKRNEVTWGTMITGYLNEGDSLAGFELLERMPADHLKPDEVIFVSALKACTIAGALNKGMLVHNQVIRGGLDTKTVVSNMLVHMYAGCKSFNEAYRLLEKMPEKDIVSWSALITGLASTGKFKQAEELLEDMQHQGLKPDDILYIIILSAYTHNGLLEEGLQFYRKMAHMQLSSAHFNCLIDLFSRAGRLNEAEELSQAIPFLPDMIGRTTLLTSSNTFGYVELGRHCFDQVVGPDFQHDASSIVSLVSSDEASENKVNQVQEIVFDQVQVTMDYVDLSSDCGKVCLKANNKVLQLLPEGKRCTLIDNDYHLGRLVLPTLEKRFCMHCDLIEVTSELISLQRATARYSICTPKLHV